MRTAGVKYAENGGVAIIEIDVPDPSDDEVQVAVSACGICSWDISAYKRGNRGPLPAPGGHEGIGYVAKVGKSVKEFKEGDRVVGGAFQKFYNRAARKVYRLPADDLPDQCWLVEPVTCVVTGLDHCSVKPGDRVAVVGCGFMGLMFLQALTRSLASEVLAVCNRETRACIAATCGAKKVIVAANDQYNVAVEQVRGTPLDIVVDCTGSESGLELSSRLLRPGGRLILFGWIRDGARLPADLWHLGGFTVINASPWSKLRDPYPPAIKLLEQRVVDLHPLITHSVPLAGYPALLSKITAKQIDYIKGVVTLS